MTRPELSDREYRLFSEWLSEEYGLCFGPAKRDILRSRLDARRIALGFDSFEQLYLHLKFHPEKERERHQLLPHLTNNESYFFREPAQLDAFAAEVLPEVKKGLERASRREIRVLSAGCAAGEEAYTLAIVARGALGSTSLWSARVIGVDLDSEALVRARRGAYGANAFRRVQDPERAKYFDRCGDQMWSIKPAIKRMVEFAEANLVARDWRGSLPPQDVIFCRNVLIYFDDHNIARAIQGLYDALVPGGYLFLGHAESLSRIPNRFVPVRRPGVIYYRRPADG
ncbi:MAG TPA: protein-glutamate O-methyltransferase CheR [Longimicrobiaceae bacterium]